MSGYVYLIAAFLVCVYRLVMTSSGWDVFWKEQKNSFNEVMPINTAFFAAQIAQRFQLDAAHRILDYGCGPGFLNDYFVTKNIPVIGVDVNEFYLAQYKKNHQRSELIQITFDTSKNTAILQNALGERKFDLIVLLSIAQYFNSIEELENVIGMLVPYLNATGKIVVADVTDEKTSSLSDAFSLLRHCIKQGKLGAFVRFMWYLVFSNYRKLSSQAKLLELPASAMHHMAEKYSLDCERMDGLTIHRTRTNYILSRRNG